MLLYTLWKEGFYMTEMKHYTDIPRFGHRSTLDYFTKVASKGHKIRVMLKYDGANAQFDVNSKGEIGVYSRNNPLNAELNLNGFYQYVQERVDPTLLPSNRKIFGEWLVSHSVVYPKDMYKQFYMFDVYDTEKEEYIDPNSNEYKNIEAYLVNHCGMQKGVVLYEGLYQGMEHLEEILNRVTRENDTPDGKAPTTIDEVYHEGIVIKAHDFRDQYGNQLFVKMVSDKFKETKVRKERQPSGPDASVEREIVEFAVTQARIEKILNKLVDIDVLPVDYDLEDMPTIAKNVPKIAYDDIMKEELDTINEQFGEFDHKILGKKIAGTVISVVKDIIREKIEQRIKNL
ncbi:MAG: hypothetical protein K0R18_130 [Bacillales bacterium]|jgi:hypothetical protein|nr:hypothetical protein [Bacillales bacterium]